MAHITQFGVADAKKFRDLCHLYLNLADLTSVQKHVLIRILLASGVAKRCCLSTSLKNY